MVNAPHDSVGKGQKKDGENNNDCRSGSRYAVVKSFR